MLQINQFNMIIYHLLKMHKNYPNIINNHTKFQKNIPTKICPKQLQLSCFNRKFLVINIHPLTCIVRPKIPNYYSSEHYKWVKR